MAYFLATIGYSSDVYDGSGLSLERRSLHFFSYHGLMFGVLKNHNQHHQQNLHHHQLPKEGPKGVLLIPLRLSHYPTLNLNLRQNLKF